MYRHVDWGWAVSWNNDDDDYIVEESFEGKVFYRVGSIINATIYNPEAVKEVSDILVDKSDDNLELLKNCTLVPVERTTVVNILDYKEKEDELQTNNESMPKMRH